MISCLHSVTWPKLISLISWRGTVTSLILGTSLQARNIIQQAPLPHSSVPQAESELVTVSERGDEFRVKQIECGRPGVTRGVQRLVFASSGLELLGAMHSGATFLWSRVKPASGSSAELNGTSGSALASVMTEARVVCANMTWSLLQLLATGSQAGLGFRRLASIPSLVTILCAAWRSPETTPTCCRLAAARCVPPSTHLAHLPAMLITTLVQLLNAETG